MTNEIIRDYWDDVDTTNTPSIEHSRSVTASACTPHERSEAWTPASTKWSPTQAPGTVPMAAPVTEPLAASPQAQRVGLETADRASISHHGSISHASSILQSPEIPTSSPRSFDLLHTAAAHLLDLGTTPRPAILQVQPDPDVDEDTTVMQHAQAVADFHEEQLESMNASPASDGIFLPGSAYLEFHSTLRNHTFQAARSTFPSRCGTPERPPTRQGHDNEGGQTDLAENDEEPLETSREGTAISAVPTPSFVELTQQQEFELWKNWVDEIAPWVRTSPQRGSKHAKRFS